MPSCRPKVSSCGSSAAVDYNSQDNEANYRNDFDDGEDEFGFTVAPDAGKINCNNNDKEDGNENADIDA